MELVDSKCRRTSQQRGAGVVSEQMKTPSYITLDLNELYSRGGNLKKKKVVSLGTGIFQSVGRDLTNNGFSLEEGVSLDMK